MSAVPTKTVAQGSATLTDVAQQSERVLLGSLIDRPDYLSYARGTGLLPAHFLGESARKLYTAMLAIPYLSEVTLRAHLEKEKIPPPVDETWELHIDYLTESCGDLCSNPARIQAAALSIIALAGKREALGILKDAGCAVQNGRDPEEALREMKARITKREQERARRFEPSESVAELLAREITPLTWTIAGILPEGLALLVGPPKRGKSFLSLSWSLSVGYGGPVMGNADRSAIRGHVLYAALEDGQRRMQDRSRGLIEAYGMDPADPALENVIPVYSLPKLGDGLEEFIANYITNHPDTRLVVLDTIGRLRRTRRRAESSYLSDVEDLAGLQALALEQRLTILGNHHNNRGEAEDFLDRVSGTQGTAGTADTILYLEGTRGSADGILRVTGRDVPECELALRYDSGTWFERGDAAAVKLTLERQEILGTFHEAAEAGTLVLTAGQVARAIRKTPPGTTYLLGKLCEAGHLRTAGYGKYALRLPF